MPFLIIETPFFQSVPLERPETYVKSLFVKGVIINK